MTLKFKTTTPIDQTAPLRTAPRVQNLDYSKSTMQVVHKIKAKFKLPPPSPTTMRFTKPAIPKVPLTTGIQDKPIILDQPLTPDGLVDALGNPIHLDASQYAGVEAYCNTTGHLIFLGKAGTGKTTLVQAISLIYLAQNPHSATDYRIRGQGTYVRAPKMATIAYTNRAANNMADKIKIHPILGQAFGYNITTGHNLLEYTVEFITDPETGDSKRRYYPQRDQHLLLDIDVLVVEEATMIGVGDHSLWQEIFDALPITCRIIMLGDINQLPPVIGKPVLSYAIQHPAFTTIELTHVHRQALDNPIIRQAHNCLEGKEIETDLIHSKGIQVFSGSNNEKLPWWDFERAIMQVLTHFRSQGLYNPYEDMVLSPFNKPSKNGALTAQSIASLIASQLADEEQRKVYEIRAGYILAYYAVGDRVFYNKEEGIISNISINNRFMGKFPRDASYHMDHMGGYRASTFQDQDQGLDDMDFVSKEDVDPNYNISISKLLENADSSKEERRRTASHSIDIIRADGTTVTCTSIGEFAELQLGYALSVHKAQGSEWPNVFVALHDTNAILLYNELLYTAMTRPKNFLGIIAQKHVLARAIETRRIKGSTLEDKIEFFNGGYLDQIVDLDPSTKVAS